MNIERILAEQRVAEAEEDLKDWASEANAILEEMARRRPMPQNPQTYLDLGEAI